MKVDQCIDTFQYQTALKKDYVITVQHIKLSVLCLIHNSDLKISMNAHYCTLLQVIGPIPNRFSIPQQVEPPYHGHRKGSFYQALSR